MKFEEAMAQLRAGKKITRPIYPSGTVGFGIGIDEDYDHEFSCLLKHVRALKMAKRLVGGRISSITSQLTTSLLKTGRYSKMKGVKLNEAE